VKRVGGHDIHRATEQILQIQDKPPEVEIAPAGIRVNQDINVAPGAFLAPPDGPKNADVARAVTRAQRQDFLPVLSQEALKSHSTTLLT
jgi:hypothetical protein